MKINKCAITRGEITVKDVTREKMNWVDTNMDTILTVPEGTTKVEGLTIKRLLNTFIIF
jgi:hypothetical protein